MFTRKVRYFLLAVAIGGTVIYWGSDVTARRWFSISHLVSRSIDLCDRLSRWGREQRVISDEAYVVGEESLIDKDVDRMDEQISRIAKCDPGAAAAIRELAADLLATRHEALDLRRERLQELSRQCMRDVEQDMLAERHRNAEELWRLASRKVSFQRQVAEHSIRRKEAPAREDTAAADEDPDRALDRLVAAVIEKLRSKERK